MKLSNVLAALLAPSQAAATAVFAHFMVGNTPDFTVSDWTSNMNLAKDAHIDAFALNMAYDWHGNEKALELAFQAGAQSGFQLFFSFDYAGNGPWPQGVVQSYIQKYGKHSAYFQHNGQPLVSTFEGPENAQDWVAIKQSTGCFFVPDWSSLGAGPASTLAGGVADGLFNWAAWAYGKNNMTTYVDASYTEALKKAGNKPYMMPVSPWFYTNLPGYNKNWAWRGDNLWYDRWQHVWNVKPEWVQIISWNDYGESHYIGPLDDRQYEAFEIGKAPYNFVKDMPHDGWRTHLPFLIDTYKNRNPSVLKESVVMWHRRSPGKNCGDGGTTGNTASQLQIEYEPSQIFEDRIYVAALLASPATLQITDGEHLNELVKPNEWDYIPADGVGIYQTSVPMDSLVDRAEVNAELNRAVTFATAKSSHTISSTCNAGLTNWNAVVSSGYSSQAAKSDKALKLSEQACVEGFGATRFGDFNKLCSFTCKYNYCPLTACVCTKSGKALEEPKSLGIKGYSSNGDANYDGLCDYACDHGYCPLEYCSTTKPKPYIPPNSPFSNEACVNGEARSSYPQYDGLCRYSCNLGYCPIKICTCTSTGWLNPAPAPSEITGQSASADDAGICNFACSRGYCPTPCISSIPVNFIDDSCTSEMQAKIQGEMSDAYDMALAAKGRLQNGVYYEHFFPKSLRDQPGFAKDIADKYERIADLLGGRSKTETFHVTCNFGTEMCQTGFVAHMNDDTHIMNFCSSFFKTGKILYTQTALNQCDKLDLRQAQWTMGAIILHEATHTKYAMGDKKTVDVAYGFNGCTQLAKGGFDRSKVAYGKRRTITKRDGTTKLSQLICPNGNDEEGVCDPEMSVRNADTYSFIAAGIFFSQRCNKDIPLPACAPTSVKRDIPPVLEARHQPLSSPTSPHHPHGIRTGTEQEAGSIKAVTSGNLEKRASCSKAQDWIIFDGVWDSDAEPEDFVPSTRGYAHFGDSYASGMGTGVTTTDKCRVGSNNYGDLIYNFFGSSSIPYQRLSCSGDTTDGLNAQIDKWTGADQVDLVTLTMGGNDLGFSDLVYYCVVTPNTWRWGSSNRNWCAEAKKKARDHMADTSSNGLQARLKAAYQRILDKTGRQDTQLYVAGYPTFFDTAGTTCDKSTFHYLWAGYNPSSDWPLDRIVYLTQDLRIELNNLVRDLNDVIIEAVNDANNAREYTQVHYVDVSYAFESGNHLWCEGSVKEPDSSRDDTWFFLSGWPDVDADAAAASNAEAAERQALFSQGSIPLPDPATCDNALGSNPDPYASYMCRLSHVVTDFPGGPEAALYNKANGDVKAGNFNSQEVGYFAPTRQIKTFHPRTPGMYKYRDLILEKIAQTSGL
ncbi:Mutanase Pc12g07500-like protein 1 [Colletotrichum truncatum]|uniref:Mutanase Pc12g07500-like protein 1 n=1 Tax=Colletotrichum truncatum TaxID=5467 RepID=A0ACC3Z7A9_COLTU|nr:Mutanase Pc12g07500-like protein 1 [Colletotrichum truncatum]KAF6785304.1 Mutanase Pc12g07500-like protein 1 [Colletotrichum truncatum]